LAHGLASATVPICCDDSLESQVVVNEPVVRPEALSKFFACDNFLGMLQQQLQHLEGLPDEFQPYAGLT
jgi:hypothetical protein